MLAAAALTWGVIDLRREPPRVIHASIMAPGNADFVLDGFAGPMVLSPDGKRIAFVAATEGKSMLWVRPLDVDAAQPLAGTEGAQYPFWSPSSRYLGFFSRGKLEKIGKPAFEGRPGRASSPRSSAASRGRRRNCSRSRRQRSST